MKKTIIALFLLSMLFTLPVNWQNSDTEITNTTKQIETTTEKVNPMTKLHFKFCQDGLDWDLTDTIDMAVDQWSKESICFVFDNQSDEDIKLLLELTDTSLNSNWNEFCNYKEKTILDLAEGWEEFKEITIPANNYLVQNVDINFPLWLEWELKACVAYSKKTTGTQMIKTRVLYWKKMNFFVGNLKDINNDIVIESYETTKNTNWELVLNVNLKNAGNVENKTYINGSISNMFWFQKTFSITWDSTLTPWSVLPLELNLGQLPTYGWLYDIKFEMELKPFFKYKSTNSNIDESKLETKKLTRSISYFEMPRLVIWVAILIIIMLFLAFRKRKPAQVVYVQQPWPQPQQ